MAGLYSPPAIHANLTITSRESGPALMYEFPNTLDHLEFKLVWF